MSSHHRTSQPASTVIGHQEAETASPHDAEFSVCQFFEDGSYEYVRRYVGPKEAVEAAQHYCSSVGAKIGTTQRVIITDGGDCVNFEWQFGKGITFK